MVRLRGLRSDTNIPSRQRLCSATTSDVNGAGHVKSTHIVITYPAILVGVCATFYKTIVGFRGPQRDAAGWRPLQRHAQSDLFNLHATQQHTDGTLDDEGATENGNDLNPQTQHHPHSHLAKIA